MAKLAAAQIETTLMDPEANLEKIIDRMELASAAEADLVVFPECALTGYNLSPQEAAEIAEPAPGPRTERLVQACERTGLLVVVGTIETDEKGDLFNTALMLGPQGLLARYRKTHLPFLGVDRYLMQGSELPGPFETPLGQLGMLICYDLRFPEPSRVLALRGAQAILLPTAWPRAATLYPDYMARTRSSENTIFLVAANRVGEERGTQYLGRSLITSPEGEILVEGSSKEEELLLAELDLPRSDVKRLVFIPGEYELDLAGDRRPDLYAKLHQQSPKESR
jgi:predicted amidohydrolase